ncbi:YggS family pyridoxal phosphate-dependent enzyme [Pseudothermotoga elfii]
MSLYENLMKVKKKIDQSTAKSGRDPDSVVLIAVTKEADMDSIRQILEFGIKNLAENYAQKLVRKSEQFTNAIWHFIGRIQTNKLKYIVPRCEYIHSVWREEELKEINKIAERFQKIQKVLIEVNVSGEPTKAGVDPIKLGKLLKAASSLSAVQIVGLMTMAPYVENPQEVRWIFSKLRQLRDIYRKDFPSLEHLSMGMSNDFEVALEEGATMIRIGRAIFKGE